MSLSSMPPSSMSRRSMNRSFLVFGESSPKGSRMNRVPFPSGLGRWGASLALGVFALLGMGVPHTASAQVTTAYIINPGTPDLFQYTGVQNSLAYYLAGLPSPLAPQVPPGNGIIPLLMSIDSRLGGVNSGVGQVAANNDSLNRLKDQDRADLDTVRRREPSHARTSCYDVTMGVARSMSTTFAGNNALSTVSNMGGGGPTGTNRNGYEADAVRQTAVRQAQGHSLFCSVEDINSKVPGCVGSYVSQYPQADLRSNTLTRAPLPSNMDPSNMPNYSLQWGPEQDAADQYVKTVLPPPPQRPDPNASTSGRLTEAQNVYLIGVNRYNSRMSAITDVLTDIASSYKATAGVNGVSESNQIWQSAKTQDTYRVLFPGQKYPAYPSEMEFLRYEVFRLYGDPVTIAARQSMTERELAIEAISVQTLNARLMLRVVERLDGLSKLMATMASQSLDPLTSSSMAGGAPMENKKN